MHNEKNYVAWAQTNTEKMWEKCFLTRQVNNNILRALLCGLWSFLGTIWWLSWWFYIILFEQAEKERSKFDLILALHHHQHHKWQQQQQQQRLMKQSRCCCCLCYNSHTESTQQQFVAPNLLQRINHCSTKKKTKRNRSIQSFIDLKVEAATATATATAIGHQQRWWSTSATTIIIIINLWPFKNRSKCKLFFHSLVAAAIVNQSEATVVVVRLLFATAKSCTFLSTRSKIKTHTQTSVIR